MIDQTSPVQRLLEKLDGVRQAGPRQWEARCPSHEDNHASLSIGEGEDGKVLLTCHVGCDKKDIVAALDMTMKDLFAMSSHGRLKKEILSTYDYHDEEGSLLFQTVRYVPKDFRQRRPDGKGGWIWNLKDTRRVLFRLPQLLAADPDQPIYIVEGEKDVLRLAALDLVATCNPMGASKGTGRSKWLPEYNAALAGREVVVLPDNDDAGRAHAQAVARSASTVAASVKVVELPGLKKGGDVSDWLDQGGTVEELLRLAEQRNWPQAKPEHNDNATGGTDTDKPFVLLDLDEMSVNEQIAEHLAKRSDGRVYQKANALVEVVRAVEINDVCDGWEIDAVRIHPLSEPRCREWITRACQCAELNAKTGELMPVRPPRDVVRCVYCRGGWPHLRHLDGVTTAPVLRADGTVLQTPGYDRAARLLYEPGAEYPPIPESPTAGDARAAVEALLEVVADFPLAHGHDVAWLALVLTVVARRAIRGPCPLFMFDANLRGAGKTLMARAAARVATGKDLPAGSYTDNEEESRKAITSQLLSGSAMYLFDNVVDSYGTAALCRVLTSTSWEDRILGHSKKATLPVWTVFCATGNNLVVRGDMARRVLPIRLDSPVERPEERPTSDFKHPDLLEWAEHEHPRLLTCALTILLAHLKAGRPVPPSRHETWGSYESWVRVVRNAILWATGLDPLACRSELQTDQDDGNQVLRQMLAGWSSLPGGTTDGLTAAGALDFVRSAGETAPAELRSALGELADGDRNAKEGIPSGHRLGLWLRQARRKPIGGQWFEAAGDAHNHTKRWKVAGR